MPYSLRASLYDVEYAEDRDVGFVLALAEEQGGRILELPCGAGRLSRHLVRKARHLTVADIEPRMVECAVASARAASDVAEVVGVVSDMRTLSLGQSFDLVVVPREALQLLPPSEGEAALQSIAAHVAPGGLLFVDLASFSRKTCVPPDPDYYDPGRADGAWKTDWTRQVQGNALFTRRSAQHHSADGGTIRFDFSYELAANGRSPQHWQSWMALHVYPPGWIERCIPEGLSLEGLYGGYDRSPCSVHAARSLALFRKHHPEVH
jgi:SAM-dependent methyltransferase